MFGGKCPFGHKPTDPFKAKREAGPVTRYELPKLKALNFVIENALGGGVTVSLAQDMHGKSLSFLMLDVELNG